MNIETLELLIETNQTTAYNSNGLVHCFRFYKYNNYFIKPTDAVELIKKGFKIRWFDHMGFKFNISEFHCIFSLFTSQPETFIERGTSIKNIKIGDNLFIYANPMIVGSLKTFADFFIIIDDYSMFPQYTKIYNNFHTDIPNIEENSFKALNKVWSYVDFNKDPILLDQIMQEFAFQNEKKIKVFNQLNGNSYTRYMHNKLYLRQVINNSDIQEFHKNFEKGIDLQGKSIRDLNYIKIEKKI